MKRFASTIGLGLVLLASPLAAQEQPSLLIDRIVAVVDEDPILASEITQLIALGQIERREGEDDPSLGRRSLDQLIATRLRWHEVKRAGYDQVPVESISAGVEELRARLEDPERETEVLGSAAFDDDRLFQIVSQRLAILSYVEDRLAARVFVSIDDIQTYYSTELTRAMELASAPLPPIAEVREPIRGVLRERELSAEVERWTAELRQRADVVDYYDADHRELPPQVMTLEREPRSSPD